MKTHTQRPMVKRFIALLLCALLSAMLFPVQARAEDTAETAQPKSTGAGELSSVQQNSINMLNYITVLTQQINSSKGSRVFLEAAYSSLINNIYPNAVDSTTQAQINSLFSTLDSYRMITVKRERLEYLYEQNRAQALRQAIPNPIALLSVVQSGNMLKAAASVLYMAVDSVTSYQNAASQADLQYLQSGWELDDAESEALSTSRKNAFNYMVEMVRNYSLPGDYALNEESVQEFVGWVNNTNLVRKTAWLEAKEDTYKRFGPYWLELAKCYYAADEYEKCLFAFSQYEAVTSRILRRDFDYAEALPMAIIAAKETMSEGDYIKTADRYTSLILANAKNNDWSLRYFAAQIYLDLYASTNKESYLSAAYKIAFDNVNVLVDEQKSLNKAYLEEVQEITVEDARKNASETEKKTTKRLKQEAKEYNKYLKAQRKVALPPVSEALYLNCELLFALAEKRGFSSTEQKRIDGILHENGTRLFLTETLDDRFWFANPAQSTPKEKLVVNFDGDTIILPASCITDRSIITLKVTNAAGEQVFDDLEVKEVERPKKTGFEGFKVIFTSKKASDYKYNAGDVVSIIVTPVVENPDNTIEFIYDVVAAKKALVFNGIVFKGRG